MPYVGLQDGGRVMPLEVGLDTELTCPSCGGPLRVKRSHYNQGHFIPRHFYHLEEADCGGESDTHRRMKTQAYMRLKELYPDATIDYERRVGDRYADVCVLFDEPQLPYGNGIAVEAQFKHDDKETGRAQWDFFRHGFSVYWAYLSDFEGEELVSIPDHRLNTVWPDGVPSVDEWEPPEFGPQAAVTTDEGSGIEFSPEDTCEMVVKPPLEFLEDHVFNIYSPELLSDQEFPPVEKVWFHSKGREVAWFSIWETPVDATLLEFWVNDQDAAYQDHVYMTIHPDDVETLARFQREMASAAHQDDSYEFRDRWETLATAWIDGTRDSSGRLAFVKSPGGPLKFIVAFHGAGGNTYKLVVDWRQGDHHRFQDLITALERWLDARRPRGRAT